METFAKYAALILLVITAAGLPKSIRRWRMASRCYGRVSLDLARNLLTYSFHSAHRFVLFGIIALHAFTVMGEIRWLVTQEPYPRWLYLAVIFWSWRFVADKVCPPTALFISASSKRAIEARGLFAMIAGRYRLISFLTPHEHVNPFAYQAAFGDDMRIRRGTGWRIPVYHLSDVVPIVIADVVDRSLAVEDEIGRLVNNRLGSKVHFLTSGALPSWVKALYSATDSEPMQVKDGRIQEILKSPSIMAHSIEKRQFLQDEYTSLFKEIPLAASPALPLREAQIVSLTILDREYRRFLQNYKGLDISELGGRLIEEIPSIFSRETETDYLRANRALQIAECICLGIREELGKQKGPWAIFQGASLDNKLGKLNRFRRDWDCALDHLYRAETVLREMRIAGAVGVDPQIVDSELGDTLFLEGEVWAAQFLETPSDEKRSRGLRCFREALELDHSLGREDAGIPLRIHLLAGSTSFGEHG